ncbi:unnamed protein product [Cochlearia groenlandica]
MEVIRQRSGPEDDGEGHDEDVEVVDADVIDAEVVDADVVDADVRLRFRLYDHIKASFIHLFGFEPCDPFLGYKLSYMILLIE